MELVRHRLASFAQESQRYCNYSKSKFGDEITYIIPSWWDSEADIKKELFLNCWQNCEDVYRTLIAAKVAPQEARGVLPNAVKTEINMKANLREWRQFFRLRCDSHAHPDMRYLALDLLKQMREQIPIVFDDLYEQFLC